MSVSQLEYIHRLYLSVRHFLSISLMFFIIRIYHRLSSLIACWPTWICLEKYFDVSAYHLKHFWIYMPLVTSFLLTLPVSLCVVTSHIYVRCVTIEGIGGFWLLDLYLWGCFKIFVYPCDYSSLVECWTN